MLALPEQHLVCRTGGASPLTEHLVSLLVFVGICIELTFVFLVLLCCCFAVNENGASETMKML